MLAIVVALGVLSLMFVRVRFYLCSLMFYDRVSLLIVIIEFLKNCSPHASKVAIVADLLRSQAALVDYIANGVTGVTRLRDRHCLANSGLIRIAPHLSGVATSANPLLHEVYE